MTTVGEVDIRPSLVCNRDLTKADLWNCINFEATTSKRKFLVLPSENGRPVQNAPERKEYCKALVVLRPVLYNLPPKIITIDGRAGTGKTTLGRFLAWRFNVSLLETDLFLARDQGGFVHRIDHIKLVIQHRIKSDRPIIVEGVTSLKILQDLCLKSDFHIMVTCDEADGSSVTEAEWLKYKNDFDPKNQQI